MESSRGAIKKTHQYPFYKWTNPLKKREDDEFEDEKFKLNQKVYKKTGKIHQIYMREAR